MDALEQLFNGGGTCPAAQPVRGAVDSMAGCICGVMLNDSRRADSILEGTIPGVYLEARTDPSTLVKWCFGDGLPQVDPDGHPEVGSYTTCPIWLAEWETRQFMGDWERALGLEPEDPIQELIRRADAGDLTDEELEEAAYGIGGLPGVDVAPEQLTPEQQAAIVLGQS